MRAIKFRTWDKKYHMLEYDDSPDLLIGMDGKVYQKEERYYAGTTYVEYEVANHYEIMQYTGLKDKNGKEIYEGDILRITSNFELRKDVQNQVVEYREGYFHTFEWTLFELLRNRKDKKQTFEVIGNIYENPELLNGVGDAE
ncbi:YopX family protein [Bacillus cytotoxicus]|uniref:YopX family protein n=1 Tax=Bacillus cytotoxicus TaxID=580165 RepID=UPI003D65B9D9